MNEPPSGLLIEVHVRRAAVAQLYALFSGAQRCGLALAHKERNSWGCWKGHCVEYAWVSVAQARREAELMASEVVHEADPLAASEGPISQEDLQRDDERLLRFVPDRFVPPDRLTISGKWFEERLGAGW